MGSLDTSKRTVLLLLISLFFQRTIVLCDSSKLYVVYMGSRGNDAPDKILRENHQMLADVHNGSEEEAKAAHVYSYRHGFKGFAAKLTSQQASEIAKHPEVVSVFPSLKRSLHTTHSWDFMGLNGKESMEIPGYSTKDQVNVIIGLIDTGIWPESPSFSDNGMPPVPAGWKGICQPGEAFNASTCNRKVIGARYYTSGYEPGEPGKPSFQSARDSAGHGSHTASIAAGRYVENINYKGLGAGGARGGAPMARIASYKACWDSGCYDADVLAAFDDAVRDGVHILSVSLGPTSPQGDYFKDAISIGSYHAVSNGIVVVAAAGNEAATGTATNIAPWIITVAASSTDRDFASDIILGNNATYKGESISVLQINDSTPIISAAEVNAGFFTPFQSSYCIDSSLNSTKASGKVLVCLHSGDLTESKLAKSIAVKEAGGVGMILIDESDKDLAIPFVIPAAIVGTRIGNLILSYLNSTSAPVAKILSAQTILGAQPAPRIAAFSSKGPNSLTPEILKPDIAAPGLNILASWSPAASNLNYNILSGTSMSCPHITGIAALIKAVHPDWSPAAIKSAIMTTAKVVDKHRKPISADPDRRKGNPFDYGSGFVNPIQVLNPGLVYDTNPTDYKEFLCSIGYDEKTLRLITKDNSTCSKPPSSSPSNLNYPSIVVPNLIDTFSINRTLTNVGYPKAIYRVAVFAPSGINVTVVPRRLEFAQVGDKLTYTVNFKVAGPSSGYVFGSLAWRNKQNWVTSPLVARVVGSKRQLAI